MMISNVTFKPKLTAKRVAFWFFVTIGIGILFFLAIGYFYGFEIIFRQLGLAVFMILCTAIIVVIRIITDYKYRAIAFSSDRIEFTTLILQRHSVILRSELEATFVPHNQYFSLTFLIFRLTDGKTIWVNKWNKYVDPMNPRKTLMDVAKEWFDQSK